MSSISILISPIIGSGVFHPTEGFFGYGGVSSGHYLEVIGTLTDTAKYFITRGATDGTSIRVVEFSFGDGGYDVIAPDYALDIDPAVSGLSHEIFRDVIDRIEFPNINSVSFFARCDFIEANRGLGEFGLWAEIVYSPIPSEIGFKFLFSISHFPHLGKTQDHVMGLIQTIQV